MSRPVKQLAVSSDTKSVLESGYKNSNRHCYRKRCQMVLLKLDGYKSSEIGKIVDSCEMSVNNWINRFELFGIEGLSTKTGQGRKPILTEDHVIVVRAAVQEERQRLSQAQKIIEENIGKSMSSATLTRFLKAITGVTNGSENDQKARVMKFIIPIK